MDKLNIVFYNAQSVSNQKQKIIYFLDHHDIDNMLMKHS